MIKKINGKVYLLPDEKKKKLNNEENKLYKIICKDLSIYICPEYDSLPESITKSFVSCIIIESKRNKNLIDACNNIKDLISYLCMTEDISWRNIIDNNLHKWLNTTYDQIL
jgi:hypothetical protein